MPSGSWRGFWRSRSLGGQLTAIVAVLVVGLLAAIGILLDLWLGSYVASSSASQLHALADPVIAREMHAPAPRPGPQPPQDGTVRNGVNLTRLARSLSDQVDGPETFAEVVTPNGSIVTVPPARISAESDESSAVPPPRPTLPSVEISQSLSSGREATALVSSSGTPFLVLVEPLTTNEGMAGAVVLGASLARGDALRATVRLSFLVGAILGAVVVGLAASRLVVLVLSPLDRLVHATRRVAGGDLRVRVSNDMATNEVGELAHAFDAMVERLEEVFEAQRRFVADASHELRSPLPAVSGMLEMLEIGADEGDPARRTKVLQALTKEVERMGRLLNGLLALSRSERGEVRSQPVQLDQVVADLRPTIEVLARDHRLRLDVGKVPRVRGDADQLAQVVVNLVENAAKHTTPGGQITVSVEAMNGPDRVVLGVSDTGAGIPPEVLPHLFEPFYRADASRTRATGGSGLGLAIVHGIVKAHGGEIKVTSRVGQGSTFVVELPAAVLDRLAPPVDVDPPRA